MLAQSLQELKQQVALRERYDNFIGGKWVPPVKGQYFDNISPITGKPFCQVARSTAAAVRSPPCLCNAARSIPAISWSRERNGAACVRSFPTPARAWKPPARR